MSSLKPHVWTSSDNLPVMDDPQLILFHRQYLQQIQNLTYPPSQLLLQPDVQNQLYKHFFDGPLKGPPAYQRRVLKQIIVLIERAINDPDEDEVSNDLMEHMAYLSTIPDTSDPTQTQVIMYTLPVSLDYLRPPPPKILIEESPSLLAAGSNVGLRTWEAALHLATYLHSKPVMVTGKKVIELGAGTGLVSLLCAGPLKAKSVLATDGLPHVVSGMEGNFERNRGMLAEYDGDLVAKVLDWADLDNLNGNLEVDGEIPRYDLILGADITYHPEVVPLLAELLRVLICEIQEEGHNVQALISGTVRNEMTMRVFWQACEERGLAVEMVEAEGHAPGTVREQTGFFHEQGFPIVIMKIVKRQINRGEA